MKHLNNLETLLRILQLIYDLVKDYLESGL